MLCDKDSFLCRNKMFYQNGRAVFKDVVKLVSEKITNQLSYCNVSPEGVSRFWMHQANIKMNVKIIKSIIRKDFFNPDLAPSTLENFGNTSSSGSILCFSLYNKDLSLGDYGVLSSFGAGYSFGSVLLKKIA